MSRSEAYEWLLANASDYEKFHFEHIAEDIYKSDCPECEAEERKLHDGDPDDEAPPEQGA